MADTFATPSELAGFLQQDLDTYTATLLLEAATSIIQSTIGQRLVDRSDTAVLPGPAGRELLLPQWPVRTVTTVKIDGVTLATTEYKLVGEKLWRRTGWRTRCDEPTNVAVTYTHGYPAESQELQLARGTCLSLAGGAYENPAGARSERIDDYAIAYERVAAQFEAAPHLASLLRGQYGGGAAVIAMSIG